MAEHPDYPRVASRLHRGHMRWRFMDGARPFLPGEPHSHEFDAAYQALVTGQGIAKPQAAPQSAKVIELHPRTLDSAYALLRQSDEWKAHGLNTQTMYSQTIERMLDLKADSGQRYGGGPLADLERRHCKAILAEFAKTPWMQVVALGCLRKLIMTGIDAEPQWIKVDPAYGIRCTPTTDGHETWKGNHLGLYEQHWPLRCRQRVAYALALWLGNRVSDVARLDWRHLVTKEIMHEGELRAVEGFEFRQFKGRKKKGSQTIFLPLTPMLERELPTREASGPVLKSERRRAYVDKSLSRLFGKWAVAAGVPKGYTMHGLRKALGVKLAHADANSRQIMFMLGHKDINYVELYTREAEQVRMAVNATDKLTHFETAVTRNKTAKLRVVK